jgi:hypothetical protein
MGVSFKVVWSLVWPKAITALRSGDPSAPEGDAAQREFDSITAQMNRLPADSQALMASNAALAYESERARREGLDAKLSAILALAGLLVAGLSVELTLGGTGRYIALPGLIYVAFGTVAASRPLLPARRYFYTPNNAFEGDPAANLLTAAKLGEQPALVVSNLATAALYDLAKAAGWLGIALIITVAMPINADHGTTICNEHTQVSIEHHKGGHLRKVHVTNDATSCSGASH